MRCIPQATHMVFWGDWIHLVELEMKICLSLGVYNVIICLSKGTLQATIHPGGVLQARLSVLGDLGKPIHYDIEL